MFHYFGTVTNTKGDALPGWFVECVQVADGATVITIYADENSTPIASVSGVANRAKSDAEGNYDFFVPIGDYSLRFYNASGVYQRTQRYISMYGSATAEAISSATSAASSASAAATSATTASTAASSATSSASSASTSAALVATASSTQPPYPVAYASSLPKGVTSIAITAGGSGGTTGTYALGVSGGPTGFAGTYTIAGGAVTAITITNAGLSTSATAPTLSFPSGSVTGATATATVASLIADQGRYWVVNSDNSALLLYGNNGGSVATAPFGATQASVPLWTFETEQANFFNHSPNLFDKDNAVTGFLNTGTGTVSSTGYFTTNYMPVEAGSSYSANKTESGSTGYAWYTSNLTYISGANGITAGTGYTAPSNAKFLRMSFISTKDDNEYGKSIDQAKTLMVVKGTTMPATYQAYGYADPFGAHREAQKALRGASPAIPNLFDRSRATAFLLAYTGSTSSGGTTYMMTDYIPVQYGVGLACNFDFVPGTSGYGWNWYDRDKNRIGVSAGTFASTTTTNGSPTIGITASAGNSINVGTPLSGTGIPTGAYCTAVPASGPGTTGNYTMSANATATGTVTVTAGGCLANVLSLPPKGAAYGRISFYTDKVFAFEVTDTVKAQGSVVIGWEDVRQTKPWAGRPFAFFADSIGAGGSSGASGFNGNQIHQTQLQHFTQANMLFPAGVSGRTMRAALDGTSASAVPSTNRTLISTDFNSSSAFAENGLVLISLGTNDFGVRSGASYISIRTLGTLGDTSASGTFFGDMNDIVIEKLLTWNPKLTIAMTTPLPRFDDSNYSGVNAGNPTNGTNRLSVYADAIKSFCNLHGLPCLDLFRMSGLNAANRSTYLVDDLHPNAAYYRDVFSGRIAQFLNGIWA